MQQYITFRNILVLIMANLAANEQVCISTDLTDNMVQSFIDIHWLQENCIVSPSGWKKHKVLNEIFLFNFFKKFHCWN